MDFLCEHLHCGETLPPSLASEIEGLTFVPTSQKLGPDFSLTTKTAMRHDQAAYNKSLSTSLSKEGWSLQPRLSSSPRLIGDFAKGLVFAKIQFGNSATLYRNFYQFQYGPQNGLLSLAILIVPHDEYKFSPTRPSSVRNLANFPFALKYFTVLPISVPTIIYGLLAENEYVSNRPTNRISQTGAG